MAKELLVTVVWRYWYVSSQELAKKVSREGKSSVRVNRAQERWLQEGHSFFFTSSCAEQKFCIFPSIQWCSLQRNLKLKKVVATSKQGCPAARLSKAGSWPRADMDQMDAEPLARSEKCWVWLCCHICMWLPASRTTLRSALEKIKPKNGNYAYVWEYQTLYLVSNNCFAKKKLLFSPSPH